MQNEIAPRVKKRDRPSEWFGAPRGGGEHGEARSLPKSVIDYLAEAQRRGYATRPR